MTIQICDFVNFKNNRYVLIDCEKGKSVIDSAEFDLEWKICDTSCHRGYTAEYFVEDNVLYGIKTVDAYYGEDDGENSEKTRMSYTGSVVIGDGSFGDFLECCLGCSEAYELYFENGVLAEVNDLSEMLNEWAEQTKESDCMKQLEAERAFLKKHLKYEYGQNYKWR